MSNLFKHNSRFAALVEDIEKPIKKEDKKNEKKTEKREEKSEENKKPSIFKENSFLREEPNYFKRDYQRRDNIFDSRFESKEYREERTRKENLKKEEEKRKKEEEAQKNLAEENFPDLSNKVIKINNNQKNIIKYSEKAAQIPENEVKQIIENNVKPGWVEIKRDTVNPGKLIYTYGDSVSQPDTIKKSYKKSDYTVLEALVNLHKRRTEEYIDTYGYDTWEKMFRFPNYDYEYFDKLDAEYEMEEEDEEEEEI